MTRKISLLALIAVFSLAGALTAGDQEATKANTGEHITVSGTLTCTACDLKKTEGARAECKSFGHTHALKTTDGKHIAFLENRFAADLIKGEKYQDKKVEIHGVYFANANVLDVEAFSVDDKKMSWCEHCSAMDACSASK